MNTKPAAAAQTSRRGVEFPDVIDMIVHDKEVDEAVLVMIETRAWNGSEEQLFQLQEKFNAYMSFALDGEMKETYPELASKPLRVQLESTFMPSPAALEFLQHAHEQLGFQSVKLEVRIKEQSGGTCGSGCGCAK